MNVRAAEESLYHVGLHPLAVLGSALVDVLSSLVGAHEANGFNGWMVTDEVHRYEKINRVNPPPLCLPVPHSSGLRGTHRPVTHGSNPPAAHLSITYT